MEISAEERKKHEEQLTRDVEEESNAKLMETLKAFKEQQLSRRDEEYEEKL